MTTAAKWVWLVPAVLWAVEASAGDAATTDQKKLQGTWQAVSAEENGQKLPEPALKSIALVFRGDKATLKNDAQVRLEVTVQLDPTKTPKHMDWTDTKDGEKGFGIYELKGDDLKICMSDRGQKERPAGFASPSNSRGLLVVLKRVKE